MRNLLVVAHTDDYDDGKAWAFKFISMMHL